MSFIFFGGVFQGKLNQLVFGIIRESLVTSPASGQSVWVIWVAREYYLAGGQRVWACVSHWDIPTTQSWAFPLALPPSACKSEFKLLTSSLVGGEGPTLLCGCAPVSNFEDPTFLKRRLHCCTGGIDAHLGNDSVTFLLVAVHSKRQGQAWEGPKGVEGHQWVRSWSFELVVVLYQLIWSDIVSILGWEDYRVVS